MITYDLKCGNGHKFEGWFANREAFETQRDEALISCPLCESRKIEKVPSAFAVHLSHDTSVKEGATAADTRAMSYIRAVSEFVDVNFEDVGDKFADEALKMHRGEKDNRSIRGTSTEAEEEDLKDEGVEFLKVVLPKYDA